MLSTSRAALLVMLCVAWVAPASRADHREPAVIEGPDGRRPIRTQKEWEARRLQILDGLQRATGPLPLRDARTPPDVKVLAESKADGFTRQTITYDADGSDRVPAFVYVPDTRAGAGRRMPAVVALHQTTTRGKLDLGGGAGGRASMAYAPELARRGYVVICPDYPSFGDYKPYDFAADRYESGTMKGVVNHMRAVDVLVARPDVDPERIGAVGHSLGGHNAIFLGVFDPRVKVIVSSCGWTPFHDYYGGNIKGWTGDVYMPRLADAYGLDPDRVPFDFPELVAALAPRAFFSVSPLRDDNFSAAGVKKGVAAATAVYDLLGAKDRLQVRYPDSGHDFPDDARAEAFAFVDRVLANDRPEPANAGKPPGAEEPDFAAELPRVPPTEPADAIKTFRTLPGFRVELAAAEPNVASPVAISFDENGRMFVCEMRDYSEQDKERLGVIRLLEDADHDGVFERSVVYADDLSWPTAVIAYGGGVFVGAAPDVIWLKDTDGDGRADERRVVFTGFSRSNVQGLLNSFNWGFDNRIHGATSTSGGRVRRPDEPASKAIDLSGRDFSFDPRTFDLRAESGGGQHGMSFDDWGRKFVSSNSDHLQMVMVDDRYLAGNSALRVPSARASIAADGPQAKVFRISPVEAWRVVRTRLRVSGAVPGIVEGGGLPAGYFTGATGVTLYRGDAFPDEYRGQAFIGDVGSNIVHRKVLEPNGAGFVGRRVDEGREFLASTDTWFRPAQFANAPDGTLYVIDVYRETIEHPASLPPMIKKHLDLTSGRDRGRIYRVVPEGYVRRPSATPGASDAAGLVALLEHRNGWHRDTAARLLYERQDMSVVPPLERLAAASPMPEARVHAMHALAGLSALKAETVAANLRHPVAAVREHAVRLTEGFPPRVSEVAFDLSRLITDTDDRVRYQLALTMGRSPARIDRPRAVGELLSRHRGDRWMLAAALALAGDDAVSVLQSLAADETFCASPGGRSALSALARQVGVSSAPSAAARVVRLVGGHRRLASPMLEGLAAGLSAAPVSFEDRLEGDAEALKILREVLADARSAAAGSGPAAARADALRLLSLGRFVESEKILLAALREDQAPEVQFAAMAALDRFEGPAVGEILTAAWRGMTPAVRNMAANVLFARPERVTAILDAAEAGRIGAADLDRPRLAELAAASDDPALRDRARKLLSTAAAPAIGRDAVFTAYRPALSIAGDAARGKAVFGRRCAACHRVGDVGTEVGPNLAAMQSRGAEAILLNVIDPNREVNPQYVNYVLQTKSGRTTSGMLASETAGAVTLRRPGEEAETIARADIRRMRSSGLSIMPEGLEQGLDHRAMADLIAFVLSAK